jgi:YVTN family beta-propeller protein
MTRTTKYGIGAAAASALFMTGLAARVPAQRPVMKARVVQTNAAGDSVHVIDVATNKVVGVIEDIEVPHGAVIAPDGARIYITNESLSTVDVADPKTFKVTNRVKLTGHPNNLAVTPDGKKVYAGIAQAPGAVDVIDTATLKNVKSVAVEGAIHNVYVTPDGKFAVSGSVASSIISVIDTSTDTIAWTLKESSGIRPMIFTTNPDGSTKQLIVQLSNYHGIVVIDFATHKETTRFTLPDIPGRERETDGIQGAPAHGLAITNDKKTLWATSKFYDYVAAYSLPDFTFIKTIDVGLHPEWLTIPPASDSLYVGVAGKNATVVVDTKAMKVIAEIPVGQVPKRNASGMLQSQ